LARTVLPSGLRIVTEEEKSVRSAAFGIWVNVGSRDESNSTAGASHFLEHLLFKGTKKRTSLEISSSIEAVGGETNAFTSKEYTCFYARVIDKHLPLAVDVISDLITSSVVKKEDVDAERKVVLEEIAMRDDDPSDLIHDLFLEKYYGDTPLGRPILGTVQSIKGMSRDTVFNYYQNRYKPEDLVVAVAGNIKHRKVVDMVENALSKDGFLDQSKNDYKLRKAANVKVSGKGKVTLLNKKTEQAHIIYGVPGVARDDKSRFALSILSSAIGGGMSSRLFQEIREKRGLGYSTYAYSQQIDRAKGSVSGALVLSQEDTGSRMTRIGKSELVYGQVLSFDEILSEIANVTPEQIREIARKTLPTSPTLAVVGPFTSRSKFERLIK